MKNKKIIPKTTKEKPYVEFLIKDNGKIKLSITSTWWGGINSGFHTLDGYGNSCLPEKIDLYINALKKRKIKDLDNEIKKLEKCKNKLLTTLN